MGCGRAKAEAAVVSVTTKSDPSLRTPFGVPLKRITRLSSHLMWTGTDHIGTLGLTRLVCFPLIASLLGVAEFGEFVLALAITTLFGVPISQGFTTYIVRNISLLPPARQAAAVRTSIAMCTLTTTATLAGLMLLTPLLGQRFQSPALTLWLAVFSAHYVFTNPCETILAVRRVERNFRYIALVHAAGAVAMLLCLCAYPFLSTGAIIAGVLAWGILPMLITLQLIPSGINWIDREEVRGILTVAVAFSASSAVHLSSGYLDRMILAFWWPAEEVSTFFAAISLGLLLNSPGLVLATLILSLLGKVEDPGRFSRRFLTGFLLASIGLALAVFFVGRPFGALLLKFFYPQQFVKAIGLWDYAVASAAGLTVIGLLRPFILKFSPPHWLPILSTLALGIRLPLLLWLVPTGGHLGAAQGLCFGVLITALIWVAVFVHFIVKNTPPSDEILQEFTGVEFSVSSAHDSVLPDSDAVVLTAVEEAQVGTGMELTKNAQAYCWHELSRRVGVQINNQNGVTAAGDLPLIYGLPGEVQRAEPAIYVVPASPETWHHVLSLPPGSLKSIPVQQWLPKGGRVPFEEGLPALFDSRPSGQDLDPVEFRLDGSIVCRIDILAATLFMLSCWEETQDVTRDRFGRFPAGRSFAARQSFLHRPLVDEFALILGQWIESIRPGRCASTCRFRVQLSHDIDHPLSYRNPQLFARTVGRNLLKARSVRLASRPFRHLTMGVDPYRDAVSRLATWTKEFDLTSAFYFMANGRGRLDEGYDPREPRVRQVIESLLDSGHEVGFHSGFDAFQNAEEFERQRRIFEEASGLQDYGGRQHYLRFDVRSTWRTWDDAGLSYDSTVGYASHEGFRCGTCHPFRPFDLSADNCHRLFEIPLIVMDGTLHSYRKMNCAAAEDVVLKLAQRARDVNGVFTLLWHNTSICNLGVDWRETYLKILHRLADLQGSSPPTALVRQFANDDSPALSGASPV